MEIIYLKNFRKGLATNSSSTHSLIYRNEGEVMKDLNIFELDYYDRMDSTLAASKEAKIKYVLANIMWNDALVNALSGFYPEMKEYYPKIREHMEASYSDNWKNYNSGLGMTCRGGLSFTNNLEASIDYLRNVIDNPEIVIVGGSDEMDFVYDTEEGHVMHPDPDMMNWPSRTRHLGVTKNGNYWVGFGETNDRIEVKTEEDDYYGERHPIANSFGGKIRFMKKPGEKPVPDFPELIDLKITNMCQNGCKFCFMGSSMSGKHASIKFLRSIVNQCGNVAETSEHRVEFSIGGGNPLLYPDLRELVKAIHDNGHIANITVKASDVNAILNDSELYETFGRYIDGIGVSVENVNDVEAIEKLYNTFNKTDEFKWKHIVAHLIPEYLGLEKTKELKNAIDAKKCYVPALFLGYKTNGRGKDCDWHEFTGEELTDLFKDSYSVNVDTTFANRYFWWIKDNFSYKLTVTLNEGEYSMYIDGVEEKAYKSSYQLDKAYNMHYDYETRKENPYYYVKEAFKLIREDNGFETFDETKGRYWSDVELPNKDQDE